MWQEIKSFFDSHQAHVERVNEQGRVAARPVYLIAGGIAAVVATAALWAAIAAHDDQLARDLMFPLLSFAGGLGLGRSSSPSK